MRSLGGAFAFLMLGWVAWASDKPDFNGTWKLKSDASHEVQTYEHDETWLHVIQHIKDNLSERTIDVSAAIDGKPHKQMVDGYLCIVIARWEGDALTWETRRETSGPVLYNRRSVKLSADGKSLTVVRTRILPEPSDTWEEIWEKTAAKAVTTISEKSPVAPSRDTPPDMKAWSAAMVTADGGRKIELLEKFRRDFPASSMRSVADQMILYTLIHKFSDQPARIRAKAHAIYKAAPAAERGNKANEIVGLLLEGGVLLKDAEGYAKRGLASYQQANFLRQEKQNYERRKQKVPSDEELLKRYRENRAGREAMLGQIYVKLGKTAEGEKLLREAWQANPHLNAAAMVLGEMAAKRGDDSAAMKYLVPARLGGKVSAEALAALESVYRKLHNGSLDGLDSMLDEEYRKRFSNPIHVEPYVAGEKRTTRVVLAEVFTGSGCPPCVAADVAFDAAMQRYSRQDLALLMYHQHIPQPDPMTNADTQARYKVYDVHGVPTYAIDGKTAPGGGGARENSGRVYDRFNPDIERDLEKPAEGRIEVTASLTGNVVRVKASVENVESDSKDVRLQIALVEKELRYSGENGIRFHPMVARSLGGPKHEGFQVDPERPATFEQSFDLTRISSDLKAALDDYEAKGHRDKPFHFLEKKYQIQRDDVAVVAFLQDAKTKHVLQSAYVELTPSSVSEVH